MLPAAAAGEMASRVRDFDWSRTSLGPIADWPPALRTAVDICLNSPVAMFVWWGPDLINIYNDAYTPTLGRRHPAALGTPARSIWADIWADIGPDVDRVVLRGESVSRKRVRLVTERNGYPEEAFVSYAYSPIPDGRGGVGGMFQVCRDETPQVLAERERDRLADRPREILESITDAFFSVDREWRFTYLNAAADRLLQRPPATLLGRNLWEEFPAAVGSTFDREYHRAVAERVPVEFEAHYPPPLDAWYEVRAYPAAEDGLSVYFQDVTARRRIEDRLRTSEERLALAVAAADLGTFYCPLPLGRIEWNDTCKAHFWLPPDAEVDIDLFYARIHPDDRDVTRAAVERAVSGGDPYDIEYRTVAPDGRQRWVRALGRAYRDAAGVPVRFDGVTLDVTARRLAADALRESERRFREMADTAPAMLWVTEPDGYCSFLSRAWYEFTGQTEAEGLGYGWADAAHPDDRADAREAFVAATAARRDYAIDFRLRRADGQYRWVIDAGRPRFGPGGEFLGFIGSVIDIHDRKLAEDERNRLLDSERAARSEAERVSRLKDEFLATLSHELRTPLNAILGWAHVLRGGPAADARSGLEVIERNARVQRRIIDDLLDMSGIVAGKVRLDVQPVALAPVIEAAVETVRPAADAKGVRLQVVLDPLAGPVSGDPSRLQQVFWNLLSNSVKHTNRGGRVQVTLARVNSHVEVGVADDGDGISPDFLPHAFERFRQADATTTRRHGGLGLGLSIVKQLVELHGGTVAAKSPGVGRGATFTVALPLSAVHPDPGEASAGDHRQHPRFDAGHGVATLPAANEGALAGVRVVVVDDEPDARELVRRILAQAGATVATAGTSADALDAVRRDRPDVLVSDLGMPGEDGYGLIRRVRALPAADGGDVPAVALTAYAQTEDRTRALLAGFTGHIAKPVEPAELMAKVVALARR